MKRINDVSLTFQSLFFICALWKSNFDLMVFILGIVMLILGILSYYQNKNK